MDLISSLWRVLRLLGHVFRLLESFVAAQSLSWGSRDGAKDTFARGLALTYVAVVILQNMALAIVCRTRL